MLWPKELAESASILRHVNCFQLVRIQVSGFPSWVYVVKRTGFNLDDLDSGTDLGH
ncbi:unnamed protein product [Linum tenue]|uniref:Uncharacterized protein n=1 Tax=Linum tenue TaxID=586396 RepID=A0AAV0K6T5_9ROSI|nr:unnamed protein product [Linum tenue]